MNGHARKKELTVIEKPRGQRTQRGALPPRNLKGTLSLKILKRIFSLRFLKSIQKRAPSLKILGIFRTLHNVLVIVYDRVGDEEKFSYKNCGIDMPRFHARFAWKLELKKFCHIRLCQKSIDL